MSRAAHRVKVALSNPQGETIPPVAWWRLGESEYSGLLKTRNLLKNPDAQNALVSEIAPNWNVSGTRVFRCNTRILDSFL